MNEHFFDCPYCGERISVVVDMSVQEQDYVEDCEVCCNPIQLSFKSNEMQILYFEAKKLE